MTGSIKKYSGCFLLVLGVLMNAAAQQRADSIVSALDTIPAMMRQKLTGAKEKIASEVKQLPVSLKQKALALVGPEKGIFDSLLQSGKEISNLIQSKINLFKPGSGSVKLSSANAAIEYTYLRDTSGVSTGLINDLHSIASYMLGLQLTVANMPFDIRISGTNGLYSYYHSPFTNFPQFNFNHKKYLELLQKQVLAKINPETVLASVLSRINEVKSQYEGSLKNEIIKIQNEFASEYNSVLTLPPNITDLTVNDLSSLKTKLIPQDILDNYNQGKQLYEGITAGNSINATQKDSLQKMALASVKRFEALEKIYSKIISWKEKFDNNTIVKGLRSHLPFTPANFKSFIKNPGNLTDIIKKHATLNGIQKIFMNITKLDIGSNPLTGGELSMQNLMNNGINTEFTNKQSSVGFVYGRGNKNVNNWQQAGLNSFTSNEYSQLMGIKFGSGWNSNLKQSVSINFFDFNAARDLVNQDPTLLQPAYISNPSRKDAVITWQSAFTISPQHKISVDLSKSFGSYNDAITGDSILSKNNAFKDVFNNEGKSNYAGAIDYKGNLFHTDVQLSLKKAGLGYNNPGNVFVRRGESRVGLSINKKLLKQKISIRYKTDFRSQHFDPAKNYTYTNFSNNVQAGYRVNRNNRFGISFRHNSYRFNNKGFGVNTRGGSYSLQGDANYIFRVQGKKIMNNFSLTRQQLDIPLLTGNQYASSTWLISHSSSLVLNKNLMTATLMMNQSDNKDYYFNTSFVNAEVNYAFTLGGQMSVSSGIGFYSNTDWNRQVGIKQQVNGTIFKNLDFDIDFSYKKSIKTIRPELANQLFVSSSIHYRF